MSGSNGREGGYELDAAIALLAETYEHARQEADKLATRLAQAKAEEKRIVQAIRALEPDHPVVRRAGNGPGRPKSKAETQRTLQDQDRWNLDPEKFSTVWAWLVERGEEPFTRKTIEDQFEGQISHHTVSRIVHRLRSVEALRLAGKVPPPEGEGGIAKDGFRLLDVEAGNAELERNAAAYAERHKAKTG